MASLANARDSSRICRMCGFTLIELMIAMVLGLMVSGGIYMIFATGSRVTSTQIALARLQENGRVAIDLVAADLRLAGRMPCGAQLPTNVFAEDLAAHIVGAPSNASTPGETKGTEPYRLDRGIFLNGNVCVGTRCTPAIATALNVPRAGLATGDKVPGTEVLTVRYVQGDGASATTSSFSGVCSGEDDPVVSIALLGSTTPVVAPGHLALLASCTSEQIFAVDGAAVSVQPVQSHRGKPKCSEVGPQSRLFDLDEQLRTVSYYLQVVADESTASRKIATLMRRNNGVVNEVVQGVERFDLRYSMRDVDGHAYWLDAQEVDKGALGDATLLCNRSAIHRCSWSDVDAVDVAMLLNTVEDVPSEGDASAWSYRYSPDSDAMQVPPTKMSATGLASGRMLRREFRTVVALRNLSS